MRRRLSAGVRGLICGAMQTTLGRSVAFYYLSAAVATNDGVSVRPVKYVRQSAF